MCSRVVVSVGGDYICLILPRECLFVSVFVSCSCTFVCGIWMRRYHELWACGMAFLLIHATSVCNGIRPTSRSCVRRVSASSHKFMNSHDLETLRPIDVFLLRLVLINFRGHK
jgi:hypothetical protein